MTYTIGRWLVVAIAVLGLASFATVVSAHGTDSTTDDQPPYTGTAHEWAAWMEAHMTGQMGPGAVEWMESHMGVSLDEMAGYMVDGNGRHGPMNGGC